MNAVTQLTQRYQRYSRCEAHNSSAIYEMLSENISLDNRIKALILQLPQRCWQPNLLFGAYRFVGQNNYHYPHFREYILTHWDIISKVMLTHRTQTNEVARCATLLPLFASLSAPISLLEIGTSATLCLHGDKYQYIYEFPHGKQVWIGDDSSVQIHCAATSNTPLPLRFPTIAYRAGLDISPLNPADPATQYWLECLIWPEHHSRLERLRQALLIAAADPVSVIAGDAISEIDKLIAKAPLGNQLVIFHGAVVGYFSVEQRTKFYKKMIHYLDDTSHTKNNPKLPAIHWISCEPFGIFPDIDAQITSVQRESVQFTPQPFILSLDAKPYALVGPHGQYIHWIAD